MRVRITQTWQLDGWPFLLEIGQLFEVSASLAIYLFALHYAELDAPPNPA